MPTSSAKRHDRTSSATNPGSGEEVRLLETREVPGGLALQTWAAPSLARRARPGQFVHVLAPRHPGLLLPVLPIAGFDRVAGTVDLLLPGEGPGLAAVAGTAVDGSARLGGPLGRGFEIDARSRFLLVVADSAGLGRVRALTQEAVTTGRQVTVLLGARSVAAVPPSSLLPDEVEYMVATADGSLGHHGHVSELVGAYEAWADQCFAAGSPALVSRLLSLARGRDGRMGVARLGRRRGRRIEPGAAEARRRAWLQVALAHDAGCALGICAGCTVEGAVGAVRACREGPTFGAAELRGEPAR